MSGIYISDGAKCNITGAKVDEIKAEAGTKIKLQNSELTPSEDVIISNIDDTGFDYSCIGKNFKMEINNDK